MTGKPIHQKPIQSPKRTGRNAPCPCNSGKKYKHCHGRSAPKPIHHNKGGYTDMRALYGEKQLAAEVEFKRLWGFPPNPTQLMIFMTGSMDEVADTVIKAMKKVGEKESTDFGKFEYAIRECGFLVTPANHDDLTDEQKIEWQKALEAYDEQHSTAEA